MYVKDGIAYAGEPSPVILVKSVRALEDYKLWVRFINNEERIFDFAPLLNEPCYQPLKDKEVFNAVYVDFGCVTWNDGEIDIAPETIFENGVSVNGMQTA